MIEILRRTASIFVLWAGVAAVHMGQQFYMVRIAGKLFMGQNNHITGAYRGKGVVWRTWSLTLADLSMKIVKTTVVLVLLKNKLFQCSTANNSSLYRSLTIISSRSQAECSCNVSKSLIRPPSTIKEA